MSGFDDDMPAGFRDADFDMRDLKDAARRARAIERKGGCAHGSRQGAHPAHPDIPAGFERCERCKAMLKIPPPIPLWAR